MISLCLNLPALLLIFLWLLQACFSRHSPGQSFQKWLPVPSLQNKTNPRVRVIDASPPHLLLCRCRLDVSAVLLCVLSHVMQQTGQIRRMPQIGTGPQLGQPGAIAAVLRHGLDHLFCFICPLKCLLLFFSKIYTKKNFTPKSGSARQPSIFVCY